MKNQLERFGEGIMNVIERYLKRRKIIGVVAAIGAVMGGVFGACMGWSALADCSSCPENDFFWRPVAAIIAFFFGAVMIGSLLQDILMTVLNDVEGMDHLDEWIATRGSAIGYPRTPEARLLLQENAKLRIRELGAQANEAFRVCDKLVTDLKAKGFSEEDVDSEEGRRAQKGIAALRKAADDAHNAYLAEWNLSVNHMKNVSGPEYADPHAYRESLLQRAVGWS